MKIRTDFVSNSSSSSFMLVGKAFGNEELNAAWKRLHPELDEDEYDDKYWSLAEAIAAELKLDFEPGIYDYADEYVIGLPFGKMEDNETKRQFMDRIDAQLAIAFPGAKCEEVVDGGYDG